MRDKLTKPVEVANGFQPVEEFLEWILARLEALGYRPDSATHSLECIVRPNRTDSSRRIYTAQFQFCFAGIKLDIRAHTNAKSTNPDEAYNALMHDTRIWIDTKESAI